MAIEQAVYCFKELEWSVFIKAVELNLSDLVIVMEREIERWNRN